jgi:hypothetical protein
VLAAAVVLWGACIYLSRHAHEPADYRVFRGEPSDFRTISGVIQSVISGRGRGLIQLGLLLLIATPIARVAFSIVGFACKPFTFRSSESIRLFRTHSEHLRGSNCLPHMPLRMIRHVDQ